MILSEDDIIILVENYQNKTGYSQKKMAELCGMAGASTYNKWVNKKTDGGKLRYLLDFLKNTDQKLDLIFPNRNISENNNTVSEPEVTTYSCPDCIQKEKEKKDLEEKLRDKEKIIEQCEELLEMYRGKKGNPIPNSA